MLFFPTLLLHYMLNLRYLELRKFSSQSWLGSKSDSFHWPDAPIWDADFTRLAKFSISLGQQQVSQYSRVAILHVPLHSCSFIQEQQKLRIEHSTCFLTAKASPLCSQFLRPLCTIFTFGWVLIESTLLIGHAGTLCSLPRSSLGSFKATDKNTTQELTRHSWPCKIRTPLGKFSRHWCHFMRPQSHPKFSKT